MQPARLSRLDFLSALSLISRDPLYLSHHSAKAFCVLCLLLCSQHPRQALPRAGVGKTKRTLNCGPLPVELKLVWLARDQPSPPPTERTVGGPCPLPPPRTHLF